MLPFVSWVGGKIKLDASSVSLLLLVRDDAALLDIRAASRRALGEPTILVTSGEERGLEGAQPGDGE